MKWFNNIIEILKLISIVFFSSIFSFSLEGDFVFDDTEAIVKNPDVTTSPWKEIFLNDFWGTDLKNNLSHKSYRPLTIMTYRLNYYLDGGKLNSYNFKLTNLLCHIVCSIIIWQTYKIIYKTNYKVRKKLAVDVPYLAALLFVVHPIHTEVVCGVVGRADVLSTITFFVSYLFYHESTLTKHRLKWCCFGVSLIFSAISMIFKENGVTVLGFCIISEIATIIQDLTKRKSMKLLYISHKESIARLISIIVFSVILLTLRWKIMGNSKPHFKPIDNPAAFSDRVFTRVATYNYIYFLNFLLLIWPHWLCFDWSMGCIPLIEEMVDTRIILIILLYAYGSTVIFKLLFKKNSPEKKRLLLTAYSLIIIPYLPASNLFFTVGFVLAERILYISSVGYCLLIAMAVEDLVNYKHEVLSKVVLFLYGFLIFIYALKTYQRSFDWQNEFKLFTSGLKVCPQNAKVHYNVAKVADASNNTVWASAEYKQAIALYPEYYQAMNNLANLLKNEKQYVEAEYYLRKAIQYKVDFPAAWMNLGIVLAHKKIYNESRDAYLKALKYRKNYPDCYYNFGNLYLDMNMSDEAIESWNQAITLNPKHILAWSNLLALLDNTGQTERALKILPTALNHMPETPSINFIAANIYGKIGKFEQSEEHFFKAISLFGDRVQAIHYANLGVLYHRWKKYGLAEKMYNKALEINPNFRSAIDNRKSVRARFRSRGV